MPKFKPNAYGEFVSEFRKTKAKEGINYPSFDAAAKDANSLWQSMSAEKKEQYKIKAQKHKEQLQAGGGNHNNSVYPTLNGYASSKKTCQGKLLSEVDFKEERMQDFIRKKKRYTQNLIRNSSDPTNLVFNIMHTITYMSEGSRHYHAELAVSKFSVRLGLFGALQMFIDQDPLPTGFIHEAQSRSEKEHHIMLPPEAKRVLNPKNYKVALNEITNFMQPDSDGFYHIYTEEENIRAVENFFEQAALKMGDPNIVSGYLVHDYLDLYFNFMKVSHRDELADTVYKAMIRDSVGKDRYDMKKELSCEFHVEMDRLSPCSLSKVQRWAYYICEHVCNKFHIYMIERKHYPVGEAKTQTFDNKPPLSFGISYNAKIDRNSKPYSSNGKGEQEGEFSRSKESIQDKNLPSSSRQGKTAGCARLKRGGGAPGNLVRDRNGSSSSSEETDYPHNDAAYANVLKSWNPVLSATDVDPLLSDQSDEGVNIIDKKLETIDMSREVPLLDKFPKRNPIDPSLSSDECDTGIGMKLEIIDESREVPLVDKFPKRKLKIAANFDKTMD